MNKEDAEMILVNEPEIIKIDEILNKIPEKLEEEIMKSEEVSFEH
jgi:hypothetical protein